MHKKRIFLFVISIMMMMCSVCFAEEPDVSAAVSEEQGTVVSQTGDTIIGSLETFAGRFDEELLYGPEWTEEDWIAVMDGKDDLVLPFTDSAEVKLDICQTVIQDSFQYLGVPYVWGGKTPAGFDCSGFVNYVMAECGLWDSQIGSCNDLAGYCTVVDIAEAQPGDLIFFSGTTSRQGYSHVAIYLGCGQVINSASSSGVSIADIRSGYWAHHFACVARPNVFLQQS